MYGGGPRLGESVSKASILRTIQYSVILPIVFIAPAQLEVSQPIQEAHSLVFARVPAVRVFRLRPCAHRHGKPAHGVEFETWVGVADMELNGGADWGGRLGVVDDYSRDVPGSMLDESVTLLLLWP